MGNFVKYSGISAESIRAHLPISIFQGTPDIVIKKRPVIITGGNEEDELNMSVEESVVEEVSTSSNILEGLAGVDIPPEMVSSGDSDYFICELTKQQGEMTAVERGCPNHAHK